MRAVLNEDLHLIPLYQNLELTQQDINMVEDKQEKVMDLFQQRLDAMKEEIQAHNNHWRSCFNLLLINKRQFQTLEKRILGDELHYRKKFGELHTRITKVESAIEDLTTKFNKLAIKCNDEEEMDSSNENTNHKILFYDEPNNRYIH